MMITKHIIRKRLFTLTKMRTRTRQKRGWVGGCVLWSKGLRVLEKMLAEVKIRNPGMLSQFSVEKLSMTKIFS